MTDQRLQTLMARVKHETLLQPCAYEEDRDIKWRLWLLNVPREELIRVQDETLDLAIELYGDNHLPVLIGVATPEKTALLLEGRS